MLRASQESAENAGGYSAGDTAHDRDVAAELGVGCVLIAHGHQSKQRLEAVHHHVVESLGVIVGLA